MEKEIFIIKVGRQEKEEEEDPKKRLEKLLQEKKEEYYKEHGRWPDEDGITIHVNI